MRITLIAIVIACIVAAAAAGSYAPSDTYAEREATLLANVNAQFQSEGGARQRPTVQQATEQTANALDAVSPGSGAAYRAQVAGYQAQIHTALGASAEDSDI